VPRHRERLVQGEGKEDVLDPSIGSHRAFGLRPGDQALEVGQALVAETIDRIVLSGRNGAHRGEEAGVVDLFVELPREKRAQAVPRSVCVLRVL
jgi:hypothetical protein